MKNKKDLFRWIILLPASLISGFLAKLLTHIILYLSLINGRIISGVSPEFVGKIEYYIFPFVFWITSVLVAYEIAPKYKVRASMILIIAYFASLIILKVDTLSSLDLPKLVSGLVGLSLGLFILSRRNVGNSTINGTNVSPGSISSLKMPSKKVLTDLELEKAVQNYKLAYLQNNVDSQKFPRVKSLPLDLVVKLIDSLGDEYPNMHVEDLLVILEEELKNKK